MLYPNAPETFLPKWCKGGKNEWELVSSSEDKKLSSQTGHEEGLPSSMPTGESQMTTAPWE